MMDPVRIRNDKLAQRVIENLKRRHFEAHYVQTADEAQELALSLIPAGASVSWGGSTTLAEIGLYDALKAGRYDVLDRDAFSGEARMEAMRRALLCESFVTGVNAVSEDGVLVQVDGRVLRSEERDHRGGHQQSRAHAGGCAYPRPACSRAGQRTAQPEQPHRLHRHRRL